MISRHHPQISMQRDIRLALMRGLALIGGGATGLLIVGLTLPFVQLMTGFDLGFQFGFEFYQGMAGFITALLSTVALVAITIELVQRFARFFRVGSAVATPPAIEPSSRSTEVALRPPRLLFAS